MDVKDALNNLSSCSFGKNSIRKNEKNIDENKSNNKKTSKYTDDISMFMTWQNWCWMQYSWSLYQKTLIQTSYNYQIMSNLMQQQSQSQQLQHGGQPQQQHNQVNNRTVFKLASIKKRIAAEIIDYLLLALVKVFVIYYYYGEKYLERFNFILIIDEKTSFDNLEWMLVQALLFRAIVVAYEGYMLSGTLPFSHGCTLGKHLLGLKTVYCADVEDADLLEDTVRISPAPLGVARSCGRSLLKNMCISFLFPMLLPMLMFSHNRLIYDVAVSSLVVEKQNNRERRNNGMFR